jgi:hypothetical protein
LLGLTDTGVEVGVLAGEFSKVLYEECKFKHFYLVDPWKCVEGNHLTDPEQIENSNKMYEECYEKVNLWAAENYGVETIRDVSLKAVDKFEYNNLDFVYIDANHLYDYVKADIGAWWQRIRSGGILAGHDYFIEPHFVDVKKAVDEFALMSGRHLYVTTDDAPYYSWWIFK